MSEEGVQQPAQNGHSEPEAALPDYVTSPNAVFNDEGVQWRYGRAPDYTNTRRVWAEGKQANHVAGSLPELVENLVKNWEVEASFKVRLQDWRTIDQENYTFSGELQTRSLRKASLTDSDLSKHSLSILPTWEAMNGEAPQSGEHMLKVGTYNAIIQPNEYYCPIHSDFASSHKTFKRMMPTFAWEVLEVYSGPPKVSFKWRHWGVMKNDYVGFNDKGEKVTAKAHGGPIEIFGITAAQVNDKLQLQAVDTYMDPLAMFRQIAPNGIVNKQPMNRKVDLVDALDSANGQSTTPMDQSSRTQTESQAEKSSLGSQQQTCPFAAPQQMSPPQQTGVEPAAPQKDTLTFDSEEDDMVMVEPEPHIATDNAVQEMPAPTNLKQEVGSTPKSEQIINGMKDNGATGTEMNISGDKLTDTTEDTLAMSVDFQQSMGKQTEDAMAMDQPQDTVPINEPAYLPQDVAALVPATQDVNSSPQTASGAQNGQQEDVHPHPKDVEASVNPYKGEAVAAPADSTETRKTHQEMATVTSNEVKGIMNSE